MSQMPPKVSPKLSTSVAIDYALIATSFTAGLIALIYLIVV
jgi:hypothetical protein